MADTEPIEYTSQYEKILAAPGTLTTLLEDTDFFDEVLRGYPEDYPNFIGDIATVSFKGIDFTETHGARNRPDFLRSVIGLCSKGTKTEVHDAIIANSVYILSKFEDDPDWVTINGNVRNTFITNFDIYPELTGKSLLTTAIIQLRHDVRWRR